MKTKTSKRHYFWEKLSPSQHPELAPFLPPIVVFALSKRLQPFSVGKAESKVHYSRELSRKFFNESLIYINALLTIQQEAKLSTLSKKKNFHKFLYSPIQKNALSARTYKLLITNNIHNPALIALNWHNTIPLLKGLGISGLIELKHFMSENKCASLVN